MHSKGEVSISGKAFVYTRSNPKHTDYLGKKRYTVMEGTSFTEMF